MNAFLLDVNVLIALVDPAHVQHDEAHDWFSRIGRERFATCPITENGLLRILGHPRYPNSPGPPGTVVQLLSAIRSLPGHRFWPDGISIAETTHIDHARLTSPARVTDAYLLALARANGGRLATMDRKLATEVVPDGTGVLEII